MFDLALARRNVCVPPQLFSNPYDEQEEFETMYYQKSLPANFKKGGVAFMS